VAAWVDDTALHDLVLAVVKGDRPANTLPTLADIVNLKWQP